MTLKNEQQEQMMVSLPPVRPITQEIITQVMSITIQWMSDPLNPNRDSDFRNKMKDLISSSIDGICDGSGGGGGGGPCPDLPSEGKPQPEKNGNKDANTWKTTKMVGIKYKGQYKVVDDKNVNIAVEFKSQATAQQYIDHYKCAQSTPQITKAIIKPVPPQIPTGATFTLDGNSSTAAAGATIITYTWTQTKGNPVVLPTPTSPTVGITTGDTEEVLEFKLIVTDDKGTMDSATISVNVSNAVITPTPTPTPIPVGGRDIEGIQMLYPDDPTQSAQQWFLSKYGPNDARVSGKGARKIISGNIVEVTPDPGTHPASARIYIRTTNPSALDQNKQLESGKDWAKMAKQKYMVGPEDFRNCEVTAYYKITKSSAEDEMTFYWMGGAHPSGDTWPLQCIACCNKAQIKMDMTPRAAKEYHHFASPDGYAWNPKSPLFDLKSALGGTMVGKMIGQKLVMYVIDNPDGTPKEVHLKLYVDTQSKGLDKPNYDIQKWDLFCEWIDNGSNWPDPKNAGYITNCNAKKGQMISWGGPYVALRLDDNIWQLHSLSIRPIIAPPSI
jgi:K319-like protein